MKIAQKFLLIFMYGALSSSAAYAALINPSFEDGLNGWDVTTGGNFGHQSSGAFATDGARSARIWSATTCLRSSGCGSASFSSGDYRGISQSVDMTGINAITFDSTLAHAPAGSYSTYQSFTRASAYIGSTLIWAEQSIGQFLNINVDTSLFTGIQTLEFRIEAISDGVDYKSDHLYIDNIRSDSVAVPEPSSLVLLALGLMAVSLRRTARS